MQYLWKQLFVGKCPAELSTLGRCWGNESIEKSQTEIDIMDERDKNVVLLGECK